MNQFGESITTTIQPSGGRIATPLEKSRVDQEESQSPATAARPVGPFEKHQGFGYGHERRGRYHKLLQSCLLWWVAATLQTCAFAFVHTFDASATVSGPWPLPLYG
jgi:hypothetical protein